MTGLQRKNGTWELTGDLTLECAEQVLREAKPWLENGEGGELRVDLSGVDAVDSAAVALLLEWQRQARRQGRSLQIVSAPERLRAIARISNLEDILNFA